MYYTRACWRGRTPSVHSTSPFPSARRSVFEEEADQVLLEDGIVRLFSFDPDQEVIVQWTP